MRKDQNITHEELGRLWATDAKRALYEWSYRIYETPSAMENPASFVEYLFKQFSETVDPKALKFTDASNFSNITEAFNNGRVGLKAWTDDVRAMAGGETQKPRTVLRKVDHEVERHITNALAHHFAKKK